MGVGAARKVERSSYLLGNASRLQTGDFGLQQRRIRCSPSLARHTNHRGSGASRGTRRQPLHDPRPTGTASCFRFWQAARLRLGWISSWGRVPAASLGSPGHMQLEPCRGGMRGYPGRALVLLRSSGRVLWSPDPTGRRARDSVSSCEALEGRQTP